MAEIQPIKIQLITFKKDVDHTGDHIILDDRFKIEVAKEDKTQIVFGITELPKQLDSDKK